VGAGGIVGKYSGPLTPHPVRDIRSPIPSALIRMAIMVIFITND